MALDRAKPDRPRRRGRPGRTTSVKYDAMMNAALRLFLTESYRRVTVRRIAAAAEADIALVSYYFGNKEGLYQAAIRHAYAIVLAKLRRIQQHPSAKSVADLCALSYRLDEENPGLHRLVFDALMYEAGPSREFIREDIIRFLSKGVAKVFSRLIEKNLIDPSLDPELLVDAWVGLCIRPYQTKRMLVDRLGAVQATVYIQKLVEQNAMLFEKAVAPVGWPARPAGGSTAIDLC